MRLRLSLVAFAWLASPGFAADAAPPHLPLDMDGYQYRALGTLLLPGADPLQEILALGQRNLQWLDKVNAGRPEGEKLELTTAATTTGYPVETPKESNRDIIQQLRETTVNALPESMKTILLGTDELPATPTEADDIFLTHVRAIDKVYQNASRWLLQEPYLAIYALRAAGDVRGYYFLTREPDIRRKLQDFATLPADLQAQYRGWLITMCLNSETAKETCLSDLDRVIVSNDVVAFYDRHLNKAKQNYDSFFAVQNPRSDATYQEHAPDAFTLPFLNPLEDEVKAWLRDNIEDEWRFESFQLRLDFDGGKEGSAHVVFEPGATPHVDGLGGSTITMDANRDIQQYLERWTIRHEFGHVLGFPDCYIEYYDTDRAVMVSYQIDLGNIMCSRLGHLQKRHVDDLRAAYQAGSGG